jgi:hypothetical protein
LEYKLNRKKQRPHLRKSKQTGTALMADDKKASQQLLQQLKQQLDAIKQEKVKNTFIYQDLRQDVLKSQGSLINWWLGAIGIILVLSGVYGFFVIDYKIKVLDGILEKAESTLAVIKTHSKNAKKYEEEAKVSAMTFLRASMAFL